MVVVNSNKKNPNTEVDLIIWDSENPPPSKNHQILLWSSFKQESKENIVSIPKLVETESFDPRSIYLSWVHDLGEHQFKGKKIRDHFLLHSKLSYWWMTLITEKSNFAKSPKINDAIRFLVFKKWIENRKFNHVQCISSNIELINCIRVWSKQTETSFSEKFIKKASADRLSLRLFNLLPLTLQAVVKFLSFIFKRWTLRKKGLKRWKNSKATLTFISYLNHLSPALSKSQAYQTSFWGALPNQLDEFKLKSNWLHLYFSNPVTQTPRNAVQALKTYNESPLQNHVYLESFLSIKVIFLSLKNWYQLLSKGFALDDFKPNQSDLDQELWPFISKDWNESIFGGTALLNLLYFNLFNSAFDSISLQKTGFYLKENQGWESACISAWKRNKHGLLNGVLHSTVRYWDLRYFFDPKSYQTSSPSKMLQPDHIITNGKGSREAYLKANYPIDNLIDAEALRYMHLLNKKNKLTFKKSSIEKKEILILGEFIKERLKSIMTLLNSIGHELQNETHFIVKPHPNGGLDNWDFPNLNFKVLHNPIQELLPKCHIVISGGMTSAAIDAYCSHKAVITILDPTLLNLSPLIGYDDVTFVSSKEELILAIKNAEYFIPQGNQDYFYLDSNLPKWKSIILKDITLKT